MLFDKTIVSFWTKIFCWFVQENVPLLSFFLFKPLMTTFLPHFSKTDVGYVVLYEKRWKLREFLTNNRERKRRKKQDRRCSILIPIIKSPSFNEWIWHNFMVSSSSGLPGWSLRKNFVESEGWKMDLHTKRDEIRSSVKRLPSFFN